MIADSLEQPKRHWWPRIVLLWGLLLFAFPLLTGFGPPRIVDSAYTPTQQVRTGEVSNWQRVDPAVSATAYLLYDVNANQILYAKNIAEALPPASLTKLMTALLVLEAGDLQREVIVQSADLVGGTAMGLVPGEVITLEELLWGLLIPSGNDAAMTLARAVGGTVDTFVAEMNQRADALGLRATRFANPHGLDAEGHLSSAVDMLALARANWDYPLFREIVGTTQIVVNGHALQNTNQLLGVYPGTTGVKTGTTDAAGQCLVASFEADGRQVVGIVFGSTDRYADMRLLHQTYLERYRWLQGDSLALSVLNQLHDADGRLWYLRPSATPPAVFVHAVEIDQLAPFRRLALPSEEPWTAGLEVGVLEWRLHNRVVGTQPLVLW